MYLSFDCKCSWDCLWPHQSMIESLVMWGLGQVDVWGEGGEAHGDVDVEAGESLERWVKTLPPSHLAVYRHRREQPH